MLWPILIILLLLYIAQRATRKEPFRLVVERHTVPVRGLPTAFDGVEFIHVSDLHLSGHMGDRERGLIHWIRSHEAPVAVFTGDFIADDGALGHLVSMMMEMARGKQVFAVLGDQDYAGGRQSRLVPALEGCGVTVLRNRAVTLSARGSGSPTGAKGGASGEERLWLVGIDDPVTHRANPRAAFDAVEPGGSVVALCHSPQVAAESVSRGADLLLAGHTLGGKVHLPLIGPLGTPRPVERRLARGLVSQEGSSVYVNRGFGTPRPVFRWGSAPEVAVLRLASVPSD